MSDPPKANYSGRDCASQYDSSSVGPKANRVQGGQKGNYHKEKENESQKELLDEIDLARLEEWSGYEQEEAQELLTEYTSIFAMSDMDLGKISIVKHSISLTDNNLFKE